MPEQLDELNSAMAGRYLLEQEVGSGGMATVFLAHDPRHNRKVAVKIMHPDLATLFGPKRFLQEIETTASLQHPHILPLFDSGQVANLCSTSCPTSWAIRSAPGLAGDISCRLPMRFGSWAKLAVALFGGPYQDNPGWTRPRSYDASSDGQRFLLPRCGKRRGDRELR